MGAAEERWQAAVVGGHPGRLRHQSGVRLVVHRGSRRRHPELEGDLTGLGRVEGKDRLAYRRTACARASAARRISSATSADGNSESASHRATLRRSGSTGRRGGSTSATTRMASAGRRRCGPVAPPPSDRRRRRFRRRAPRGGALGPAPGRPWRSGRTRRSSAPVGGPTRRCRFHLERRERSRHRGRLSPSRAVHTAQRLPARLPAELVRGRPLPGGPSHPQPGGVGQRPDRRVAPPWLLQHAVDEPLAIAGYTDAFPLWGDRWWCYDFPPA